MIEFHKILNFWFWWIWLLLFLLIWFPPILLLLIFLSLLVVGDFVSSSLVLWLVEDDDSPLSSSSDSIIKIEYWMWWQWWSWKVKEDDSWFCIKNGYISSGMVGNNFEPVFDDDEEDDSWSGDGRNGGRDNICWNVEWRAEEEEEDCFSYFLTFFLRLSNTYQEPKTIQSTFISFMLLLLLRANEDIFDKEEELENCNLDPQT